MVSVLALNQRFAFQTTAEQVRGFNDWLADQIQVEVVGSTIEEVESAYWTEYVQQSYRKGAGRAFDDTRRVALAATPEELAAFGGSREEFLRSSFGRAVSPEKVKLLAGRVFTDLKGINQALSTQISRTLTDGLAQGQNPRTIARNATELVDKIGRNRAEMMARTEIVRAHAEAQLDAMEDLGVTEVGVMVEWSTAGDDRVCELCQPLEGVVMTIQEARGAIPRHVNCRCAFLPANVGEPRGEKTLVHFTDPETGEVETKHVKQVRGQKGVQRAFEESLRAEIPKRQRGRRSLATQRGLSRWQGADTAIARVRPSGLLDARKKGRRTKAVMPGDKVLVDDAVARIQGMTERVGTDLTFAEIKQLDADLAKLPVDVQKRIVAAEWKARTGRKFPGTLASGKAARREVKIMLDTRLERSQRAASISEAARPETTAVEEAFERKQAKERARR